MNPEARPFSLQKGGANGVRCYLKGLERIGESIGPTGVTPQEVQMGQHNSGNQYMVCRG